MGNKKAKKRKIEEDEDENQILDESEIARDLKNPKIYIRLFEKNSHTIKGKRKKSDRVYNSAHPCPLCDKCVTNFSHHILSKQHENEDEVLELGDNPAERKRKIQLLRLKGSHVHNVKVLQKKKRGSLYVEEIMHSGQ
ncbi:hypothetical protein KP79_PYT23049 [Mizuhopecten yessoensis]|uniref:Uncharacterized protein n=2 Tax=Mizuhopecten yessoensis TaxID=6573 RepID=A0A210PH72_MIZYE|nr:hypothetical protein KP79_PYT23049 [Mizuhopecten yessoensis]